MRTKVKTDDPIQAQREFDPLELTRGGAFTATSGADAGDAGPDSEGAGARDVRGRGDVNGACRAGPAVYGRAWCCSSWECRGSWEVASCWCR